MSVITDQIGYLEYDYLTEPYLMGFITSGQPFQFQAVIQNASVDVGLQQLNKIFDTYFAGSQWQSLIKKQSPAALQFQASIKDVLAKIGLQSQNKISRQEAPALQFQSLVEATETIGAQFEGAITNVLRKVAFQFQAKNTKAAKVALQSQAAINKLTDIALQFQAQVSELAQVGMQFEGFISTTANFAVQSENKVYKEDSVGLQFESKNSALIDAGMQARGKINTASNLGVEFIAAKGWPHYRCGPGYLEEFGYLQDWPYLAPRICVAGGLQFQGKNLVTDAVGLQAQGKITETSNIGLQFQGKIYEQLAIGVQFAGKRYEEHLVALQTQGKIYETLTSGLQFQGKIYEEQPVGLQLQAVQILSVGLQLRVAIYNTTNLRILCEFPSRGTSGTNWTADSTATSTSNAFTVNNLNTDIVEQVWRSAAGSSATLTCDTESPGGVFVDTVAILNHNLSGGATVQLQYSDNNISWDVYANMLVEKENMYYIAPSLPLTSHRYWRFIINDPGSSYIQVGTIVFGSAIIFQGECFVDTVRFGKKQFADKVFTEGHTNISNDRGKKRFLDLDFQDLNFGKANFKQLRQVFDDAGTILKCLYIPTPQTPSRFAVFGKLNDIPEETHNTRGDDYVTLAIKVDESL